MATAQFITVVNTQQLHQCPSVNKPVSLRWVLNLTVAAVKPSGRMFHRCGPNHVQVHVNDTLDKMSIRLDCGCVIAVFPKCAFSLFPLVIFLGGAARRELDAPRDNLAAL